MAIPNIKSSPSEIMAGKLREIGEVAVPPNADPMEAVIEIQAIAEDALIEAGEQPTEPQSGRRA